MAILKSGKPLRISIHHSAVRYNTGDLAELKQRASAHDRWHEPNTILWGLTTPGEHGFPYIRYHYMISAQGHLLQVQDDKYVLYANGDGTGPNSFNRTAINIVFEGNFSEQHPTDAMMRTAVKLIRDIEARYNIDPPVRGHKEISSSGTGCPGSHLGTSQSGWLKQLIANVNDSNFPPPEDWRDEAIRLPEKTKFVFNKDSALFEIDTGKRVSEFKKGQEVEVDWQYKNYLLTAWSYDRKIKNGFKTSDLDPFKEPKPPQEPEPCPNCEDLLRDISDLEDGNRALRNELRGSEKREETLRENILELNNIVADIQEQMGSLEGELEETRKERDEIQEKYDALHVNYNRIENEKSGWMEKYEDLKRECAKESPLKLLFNKLSELIKRLGR